MTSFVPLKPHDPAALPEPARHAAGRTLRGIVDGLINRDAVLPGDLDTTSDWAALDQATRDMWTNLGEQLVQVTLAAIDPLLVTADHVLRVDGDSWALEHPLSCRPNLTGCPIHEKLAADDMLTWDFVDGGYLVRLDTCGCLQSAAVGKTEKWERAQTCLACDHP